MESDQVAAELKQVTKEYKELVHKKREVKREEAIQQLEQAAHARNWAKLHHMIYKVSGGGFGPKKRSYCVPGPAQPTKCEWMDELAKPPDKGGMSAD